VVIFLLLLLMLIMVFAYIVWQQTDWIRKAPFEVIVWEAYKRGWITQHEYEELIEKLKK